MFAGWQGEDTVSGLAGKHVLVVDDNANNLMLFAALLKANGAEVTTVDSGEAALDEIKTTKPDLILLDIQMGGMDGIETLTTLKAMPEFADETPVIALTAHAMEGDKERLLAHGFSGYIAKPVDTRAFSAQVSEYLP